MWLFTFYYHIILCKRYIAIQILRDAVKGISFSENNIWFYKIPTDFKTISKIILHNICRYIFRE